MLCPQCGRKVSSTGICPYCHTKLENGVVIKDSIIIDSEIAGRRIERSFIKDSRKTEESSYRAKCRKCGAPITKFSLTCPYCFTKVDETKDRLVVEGEIKPPTAGEVSVEIIKESLNTLVTAAVECLPCEAAGLLFGDKYPTIIKACQPIQIAERDIDQIRPDIISEPLIIEASKKLRGLSFLGGYHSHPYEDPALLNFQPEFGTSLSEPDQQFILCRNYLLEIVVAFYPWETWHFSPATTDWQEDNGVLVANKDIKIGASRGCLIRVACHINNQGTIQDAALKISSLKAEKCPKCGAYMKDITCEYCGFVAKK